MPLLRLSPSSLLVALTTFALFTSIVILFSSTNWPATWCFFELNIILFILLLTFDPTKTKAIATATYFLAQALGSRLLLLGALTLVFYPFSALSQHFAIVIITLGILVKTAAAPFQQWLIIIISHINWLSILLLSTLQKLTPLLLLTNTLIITNKTITITYFFLLLRLFVGAIGIINASYLKSLLGFSSVHHLGWILTALTVATTSRAHLYIIIYLTTLTPLILLLSTLGARQISSTHTTLQLNPARPWLLILLLLSLAGLPPFPLFYTKLSILTHAASASPIIITLLLFTTAISTYRYLRFALTFTLTPLSQPKSLK